MNISRNSESGPFSLEETNDGFHLPLNPLNFTCIYFFFLQKVLKVSIQVLEFVLKKERLLIKPCE